METKKKRETKIHFRILAEMPAMHARSFRTEADGERGEPTSIHAKPIILAVELQRTLQ